MELKCPKCEIEGKTYLWCRWTADKVKHTETVTCSNGHEWNLKELKCFTMSEEPEKPWRTKREK